MVNETEIGSGLIVRRTRV